MRCNINYVFFSLMQSKEDGPKFDSNSHVDGLHLWTSRQKIELNLSPFVKKKD
jgi:hypothetical protein